MKKTIYTLSLLAALLPLASASAKDTPPAQTQEQAAPPAAAAPVQPLRKNPIDGPEDAPVDGDWKTKDAKVPRTFIHQPPVIPHDISGFVITATQNDCRSCHGVEGSGAPKPFKTHYMDRDGKVTETVAARWNNCTQCHAGQADVPPLVENVFGSGKGKYSLGAKE
ncbi:nitrate reductase cytochrome c-type subunit [Candidatus Electronema sp. TJ]|uniref:nitrate reductase cytochrome c-type subunit n=1 Tax=Candidatus Electronema sp. TJ TaxID=3401573 RepID=UPI003AA7D57B